MKDISDALRKSGLLPEAIWQKPPLPPLAELVKVGLLTQYQADKVQAGLWQGLVLGPYRILKPIGRGGMGLVYLARKDETEVALKILPPKRATAEPRMLARFKREMRFGRLIPRHPNVAFGIDSGSIDGVHYLAMEYVPGPTLRRIITKDGVLSPAQAANVGAEVAAGLAIVHGIGVIHRDIKPANIILTPQGQVKLLDFGFAIIPTEPLPQDPTIVGGSGYTMGTLDYIAPEQVKNAAGVTPAADIYGLGCTLFYALTGTPPYPGGDSAQKMKWHRKSEAPEVASINGDVPGKLSAIIARMMAKNPSDRPQSATEVQELLKPFAKGAEVIHVMEADTLPAEALAEELPLKRNPSPIVAWTIFGFVFVAVVLTVMAIVLTMAKR